MKRLSEEELETFVTGLLGRTWMDMGEPITIAALVAEIRALREVEKAAKSLRNECNGVYAVGEVAILDRALAKLPEVEPQ